MNRQLKKIYICTDVWMDILPFFERVELGLTLALLSPRFDVLVDAHFDGKRKLTIWRRIIVRKGKNAEKVLVGIYWCKEEHYTLMDCCPLPNKIRFDCLQIEYIDHSVLAFFRSNQQIFDKGTNLTIHIQSSKTESNVQPIWDVFVRQIWPIFTATNVHHLRFGNADHLDTLLRLTSPTILSDLNINSIQSYRGLFPDALGGDDGPNATPTAGQALSKWLHTPRKDGRPKRLRCLRSLHQEPNLEWISNFKETFLRATSSVSYEMSFGRLKNATPIELFELENERTNEKLTLERVSRHPGNWLLKRCPTNGETTTVQQQKDENSDVNLHNVHFVLDIDKQCIGPLSPPSEEEKAGQSNDEMFSTTPEPSNQRNE